MPPVNQNKNLVTYLEQLRADVLRYTQINLSLSTHKLYVSAFKNLLLFLGNIPIKLITAKQIDDYKTFRASQIAKSTVNIELTCIKAVFNLASKWGYIKDNPAKHASKFRIEQKEILSFNDYEIKILLGSIPEGNLKNIVLFGLFTGCRISEILNIQVDDINLTEKIIYIRNKPDFKTKTGKQRQFPVSDKLYNLLQCVLKHDNSIDTQPDDKRYLFANSNGSKLNRDNISKQFKEYLRACNLPEKYHFHCLRHTFITKLVKAGVNINYIKLLAGHSQLSTTLNYVHIVTDDLRQSVNQIKYA